MEVVPVDPETVQHMQLSNDRLQAQVEKLSCAVLPPCHEQSERSDASRAAVDALFTRGMDVGNMQEPMCVS